MVIGTYRALGQGVLLFDALRESLIFAIALAVGAIPEGLPVLLPLPLPLGYNVWQNETPLFVNFLRLKP